MKFSFLRRKSKECLNVIKTLQASTRYMHVICTSTKLDSDLALASFVPMLKKSLEATVYRYVNDDTQHYPFCRLKLLVGKLEQLCTFEQEKPGGHCLQVKKI